MIKTLLNLTLTVNRQNKKEMKLQRFFLVLLIGVLAVHIVPAQTEKETSLPRKERRKWRKQKKEMSTLEFKNLFEEYLNLLDQKVQIADMQDEIQSLKDQTVEKDVQLDDFRKQLTRVQAEYKAAQLELKKMKEQLTTYNPNLINGEDFGVGVAFRVQVGAFRKKDLKKYAKTSEEFAEEEMEDLRKYVIGNFRNYEDANVLKRYLREMGVNDAWIVPYKEGKRVELKEVLDTLDNKKVLE